MQDTANYFHIMQRFDHCRSVVGKLALFYLQKRLEAKGIDNANYHDVEAAWAKAAVHVVEAPSEPMPEFDEEHLAGVAADTELTHWHTPQSILDGLFGKDSRVCS